MRRARTGGYRTNGARATARASRRALGAWTIAALCAALLPALPARAQSDVAFTPDIYAARRASLVRLVGRDDAVIVVPGRYLVAPGDELAKQDPDFWYLTGVESPYAILVMVPDRGASTSVAPTRWRSVLFLPTEFQFAGGQFPMVDPAFRRAVWNRPRGRLFPGRAAESATGVDATFPVDSFAPRFAELARGARAAFVMREEALYVPPGLDAVLPLGEQLARAVVARLPGVEVQDVAPLIHRLRLVKGPEEVTALRQAARIAGLGLLEAMKAVRPGMNDREVAGLMEYTWKQHGSPRAAFPPIVSSGSAAMTLFTLQRERYNVPDHVMRDGDLVFIDYGAAEWMTYGSDLCRTIPANGRFTPEQRKYYDIVLEAQEAAIAAIRPGVMMVDVIKQAAAVFQRHGLQPNEDVARMGVDHVWGLMPSPTHYLTRDAGITRYSAAGFGVRDLGHHVGLEATDGRDYSRPLQPGMVVTVEPKIYIPDLGIAIMIEDEILVTAAGNENLSAHVPKRAEEIERVMKGGTRR